MADILIKNMEMPESCENCRFHSMHNVMHKACVVHLCYAQEIGQSCKEGEVPTKVHDKCPLVALPEHGDLIPYHAVRKAIINFLGKDNPEWCDLMDEIDKIDVVVEGSRGSDN